MPIPSLPLEIIGEIASNLRTSNFQKTNDQAEAGQAVSLTCKSWYQIGQALRWSDLSITIASLPSLSRHLAQHPKLTHLVQTFNQRLPEVDLEGSEVPTEEEIDIGNRQDLEKRAAILMSLISRMRNLRVLNVQGPYDQYLQAILQVASASPRLEGLVIIIKSEINWNADLAAVLVNGFKLLTSFAILTDHLTLPPGTVTPLVPRQPPFRLDHLALLWSSNQETTPLLLQSFLPSFDPTALRSCVLSESTACDTTFDWLTTSQLRRLVVLAELDVISFTLECLISYLPQLNGLETVTLDCLGGRPNPIAPVTLKLLLASFPPSLKTFSARRFLYPDYLTFPQREKPSPITLCCSFEAAYEVEVEVEVEDEDENWNLTMTDECPLTLWKEIGDTTQWYRDFEGCKI